MKNFHYLLNLLNIPAKNEILLESVKKGIERYRSHTNCVPKFLLVKREIQVLHHLHHFQIFTL